jgi:hypothetical protein
MMVEATSDDLYVLNQTTYLRIMSIPIRDSLLLKELH